jgi:hypothetical protein
LQSTIKINMYVRLSPNDEINHEKVIWLDRDSNPDLPIAGQAC